jgi:hypothetical protein
MIRKLARAIVVHAIADDLELDLRPGLAATQVPLTLLHPDYAPVGAPPGAVDAMYALPTRPCRT